MHGHLSMALTRKDGIFLTGIVPLLPHSNVSYERCNEKLSGTTQSEELRHDFVFFHCRTYLLGCVAREVRTTKARSVWCLERKHDKGHESFHLIDVYKI